VPGVDGVGRVVVGASASATHAVSTADVDGFAQLTGDSKPFHLDADYAATSRFGRPIATEGSARALSQPSWGHASLVLAGSTQPDDELRCAGLPW